MKNLISKSLIVAIAFGGFASTALAEIGVNASVNATATSQTRPGLLPKIKAMVSGEAKVNASTSAENRIQASVSLVNRLEHKFDKMLARLEATLEREQKIMARIVSRIQKVKTAGGKTTESEKFVAEAKVHLDAAKVSLETLNTITITSTQNTASTTGEITREARANMKKATADVIKHLREGHAALVKAVVNLKGMSSVNATTTAGKN